MRGDIGSDEFSLPSGWSTKSLVECTSDRIISYGIVQPGTDCLDGIPIVRVNNFSAGYLDGTDHLRVDPSIETKFCRTRLKGGEILLTLVGSTGQSAIVPKEMAGWNVARAIAVIRASSDIGANWIELCLNSRETKHFLDSRANTTVQKTLNLKDVRKIPIRIPPKPTRLGIEKISIALNRKIELNRQTNETLEAMAQAMFKSWFVDFDPVIDNALSAGNDIPEPFQARAAARQALGDARKPLAEEIRCGFPDEFVFSDEMGWVPRGWELAAVKDLCNKIQNGGTPRRDRADYWDDGNIPWLTSGEVRRSVIVSVEKCITRVGLDSSSAKWLPEGVTLVAMYGATAGQVAFAAQPLSTNQAVCALVPKKGYELFNYFYLKRNVKILERQARGSAQQNISKGIIENFEVIMPRKIESSIFQYESAFLMKKIVSNLKNIKSLSDLRDTLLPKLLSGQLTIPNAEKLVAEAL